MTSKQLEQLCDIAEQAHEAIQRDHKHIDPLIGVSQNMRDSGIPADVMTVDCLRSRKRIILILHDQQPDRISYQFSGMDSDPEKGFQSLDFSEMNQQKFYDWVVAYFTNKVN